MTAPDEPHSDGTWDARSSAGELELVPPGNPLRWWALGAFGVGAALALLVMAVDVRFDFAVFVGAAAVFLAAYGLLDFLGTFDDEREPSATLSASSLVPPLGVFGLSLVAAFVSLRLAIAGVLPWPIPSAAVFVTASALGVLFSSAWLAARLGIFSLPDGVPALHRALAAPGVGLLAITTLLYLPMLGSYSLIDPWETHYGEVAREMIARRDWISLWWAHEGWFFSKPVLNFWLQGLSFLALGVGTAPGEMLAAAGEGYFPQPEWAVRLPVVLMALGAQFLSYLAVARTYGPRAGFVAGLVLATAPYWFLLAHQSMADMPYVAPLTGAIALIGLGLSYDPDELVSLYALRFGGRTLKLSLVHLVLGAVLVTALPQILYLVSRNLSLYLEGGDRGFQLHRDVFFAGSGAGNCGLPGNEACRLEAPVHPLLQPAVAALLWSIPLGLLLFANRGERRASRLCYLGAWYLAALALLAKGAPGLVLPAVVAVAAICAARRYKDLARLELPSAALLIACVALPWYVQAYARHGSPFTDRLLFHDMYKRAFVHVHDTNAGDDVSIGYYLWQLGYGLFPWVGLAALGAVWWLAEGDESKSKRAELGALLGLWATLAFSMFAVSLTKFHHYALPVAPPLCLLTGILLDRIAFGARAQRPGFESALTVLGGLFAAGLVLLVGRDLWTDGAVDGDARLYHLFIYNYRRIWPEELDFSAAFRSFSIVAACACALLAVPRLRTHAAALLGVVAVAFTAFALNVYLVDAAPHWGQRETMLTYYATRAGEEEPLVAYQMNWKGENFYTGNRMATFVSTGAVFKQWLATQRRAGTRVIYVTTEHSRLSTLRAELGKVKSLSVLTKPTLNNKFFLARVEL